MVHYRHIAVVAALALVLTLSACGGRLFGPRNAASGVPDAATNANLAQTAAYERSQGVDKERSTIWDLFRKGDDPNITVKVNKYIWEAALDVLNFLPIEQVDPFTGVIVTGYGRPPGGGQAYRATIFVQDPALDARSLKLAMQTQGGGAVDPATIRAVEDAILTRARELRIADGRL